MAESTGTLEISIIQVVHSGHGLRCRLQRERETTSPPLVPRLLTDVFV